MGRVVSLEGATCVERLSFIWRVLLTCGYRICVVNLDLANELQETVIVDKDEDPEEANDIDSDEQFTAINENPSGMKSTVELEYCVICMISNILIMVNL